MDPIANMFTQLKNAGNASKKEVAISYSKLNLAILEILKNKGFVGDFSVEKKENQKYPLKIIVVLKYKAKNELNFSNIKRVSRPGQRVYVTSSRIGELMRGRSEVLVSTSQGIMGGNEARKKGLGGEVIGEVLQ